MYALEFNAAVRMGVTLPLVTYMHYIHWKSFCVRRYKYAIVC